VLVLANQTKSWQLSAGALIPVVMLCLTYQLVLKFELKRMDLCRQVPWYSLCWGKRAGKELKEGPLGDAIVDAAVAKVLEAQEDDGEKKTTTRKGKPLAMKKNKLLEIFGQMAQRQGKIAALKNLRKLKLKKAQPAFVFGHPALKPDADVQYKLLLTPAQLPTLGHLLWRLLIDYQRRGKKDPVRGICGRALNHLFHGILKKKVEVSDLAQVGDYRIAETPYTQSSGLSTAVCATSKIRWLDCQAALRARSSREEPAERNTIEVNLAHGV
jgi:hypothetical protein